MEQVDGVQVEGASEAEVRVPPVRPPEHDQLAEQGKPEASLPPFFPRDDQPCCQ